MRRIGTWLLAFLIAAAVYIFFIAKPSVNPRFEPSLSDRDIPNISTRGSFEKGATPAPGSEPYTAEGAIPGLTDTCASEVMIVVHGFNNSRDKAMNRFGVARQSLLQNDYKGAVVGFSWDADTQHDPYSMTGYRTGREHALDAGVRLARAIEKMKEACPLMKVRLIGYSMGARVALESLLTVKTTIDSIHLVGAAIDNEEVELGKRYGAAIERSAGRVFNYFSREDSKLGLFYWAKEGDRALGKADIEHKARAPKNYVSVESSKELPEVDKAGNVVSKGKLGRNHSGYLGTRNDRGELTDDGVMNLVARDAN